MLDTGRIEKYLPLFMAFFFFSLAGVLGGVFFSRPPVLVVTDAAFYQVYGPARIALKRRQISTALLRRVIPVIVDESAGPDLVAIAARDASSSPAAVLFPYRYLDGARFYRESNPGVPVLVMGGEDRERREDEGIVFSGADTATDLRRAALCAAVLAGEKKVLVFDGGLFRDEHRETLKELFIARGIINEPVFLGLYSDYAAYDEVGCVILTGPAERYLERNLDIPVILFSWLDPAMTARSVKMVFDDSPWALAAKAVKSLPLRIPGEKILLPSPAFVPGKRMEQIGNFRKFREIFKEKFQKM